MANWAGRRWWRQRSATSRTGHLCFAQEPSRLDEALEVLAQVHYQVGFASLELDLGVGGRVGLPGMQVPARPR